MVEIQLGGKPRQLRFSNIAVITLEKHFGMKTQDIFGKVDIESFENLSVMLWACLKRFEASLTLQEVMEMLDDALADEEVTFEEVLQAILDAFQSSSLAKGKQTKNKKRA